MFTDPVCEDLPELDCVMVFELLISSRWKFYLLLKRKKTTNNYKRNYVV